MTWHHYLNPLKINEQVEAGIEHDLLCLQGRPSNTATFRVNAHTTLHKKLHAIKQKLREQGWDLGT